MDLSGGHFKWIVERSSRTREEVEKLEGEWIRKLNTPLNDDRDPWRTSQQIGRAYNGRLHQGVYGFFLEDGTCVYVGSSCKKLHELEYNHRTFVPKTRFRKALQQSSPQEFEKTSHFKALS